jgi:hypothetical protein
MEWSSINFGGKRKKEEILHFTTFVDDVWAERPIAIFTQKRRNSNFYLFCKKESLNLNNSN